MLDCHTLPFLYILFGVELLMVWTGLAFPLQRDFLKFVSDCYNYIKLEFCKFQ